MKRSLIIFVIIFGLSCAFAAPGSADDSSPQTPEDYPKPIAYPWLVLDDFFPTTSDFGTDEEVIIEPRIVGGSTYTPENKYPWIASLQYGEEGERQHYCGGSLIGSEWVLTSAHCWTNVYDGTIFEPHPDFDRVVLGEYQLSYDTGNEQSIVISEVFIHPDYNWQTFESDIALLKLAHPATLNDNVGLIALASSASVNTPSTITGWGSVVYLGASPVDIVQHAQVSILSDSYCSSYGSAYHPDTMICAGTTDYSKDTCQGDSGGSLFFENGGVYYAAGVTSWGYKCAEPGFPGIYSRVTSLSDWVSHIQTHGEEPSEHDDIFSAKVIEDHPYQDMAFTPYNTSDPSDPDIPACNLAQGRETVWYEFSPSLDISFYIDTYGSGYDTFIAVWEGTPGSLSPIACNDDAGGGTQSRVHADFIVGSTYYIEVGQYYGVLSGTPSKSLPSSSGGRLVFSTATFEDVPSNHKFYDHIEGFYGQGITKGCRQVPFRYCPYRQVTRAEMAVFILRANYGGDYSPPEAFGTFADVPVVGKEWMESWIEKFYEDGITSGCKISPLRYCPERQVTRAEMAVFILRAIHGSDYTPPPAEGIFSDLPVAGKEWMVPWIEQFYREGITTGCGLNPLRYCPERAVNRLEMAVFISRAYDIEPIP